MHTRVVKYTRIVLLAALVSTLVHTGVARAAQGDAPSDKEWYGAPILIGGGIGGAALGAEAILALRGTSVSPAIWLPTAAVYLLTGPVVHGMHHETMRAFGSAALDIAVPFGGALLAATVLLLEPNCDNGLPHASGPECSKVVPFTILEMSFIAGPVLDGLMLARHVRPTATDRSSPGISLTPLVLPTKSEVGARGMTFGLAGTF